MKLFLKLSMVMFFLSIFFSTSDAFNDKENQEFTNRMILEKIDLYHSLTNSKFEMLIQHMNKRFELIEKRIEQVDKRIEQVDKRIALLERRVALLEGRFDGFEKRFDQVDKRLNFIELLLLALFAATIGTPVIIEARREKKMMKMTKENHDVKRLIETFRELAKKDDRVRDVLKTIDDKYFFYGYN